MYMFDIELYLTISLQLQPTSYTILVPYMICVQHKPINIGQWKDIDFDLHVYKFKDIS